jgi:hypothetical protein
MLRSFFRIYFGAPATGKAYSEKKIRPHSFHDPQLEPIISNFCNKTIHGMLTKVGNEFQSE